MKKIIATARNLFISEDFSARRFLDTRRRFRRGGQGSPLRSTLPAIADGWHKRLLQSDILRGLDEGTYRHSW